MVVLKQIEDPYSNLVLYSFGARPKATRFDQGFKRRSGTYSVLGMDYGVQPFGDYAAPVAIRPVQWQFRIIVPATGDVQAALDLAAADFQRAVGIGREQRLVRMVANKEQVNVAQCVDLQDITASADNWRHRDFIATWELRKPWRDRASRDGHNFIGDGTHPLMGSTILVMGGGSILLTTTDQTIHILADGSDGLGKPTVDDSAPIIRVGGPFGGDQGFIIANFSANVKSDAGSVEAAFLQYTKPLAAGQLLILDSGAQSATINGFDVWHNLTVPDWQPFWQQVVAGYNNQFEIYCVGTPASFVVNPTVSTFSMSWYGQYW